MEPGDRAKGKEINAQFKREPVLTVSKLAKSCSAVARPPVRSGMRADDPSVSEISARSASRVPFAVLNFKMDCCLVDGSGAGAGGSTVRQGRRAVRDSKFAAEAEVQTSASVDLSSRRLLLTASLMVGDSVSMPPRQTSQKNCPCVAETDFPEKWSAADTVAAKMITSEIR